jgi:hypothetical protein
MTDHSRIDAAELNSVRLSPDGSRLMLLLRDAAGQKVSVSVPTDSLNTMLTAIPRAVQPGTVHALDSWDMAQADGGGMILTLSTPDGLTVSFTIKSWQIEGMATVATYGGSREVPRSVH